MDSTFQTAVESASAGLRKDYPTIDMAEPLRDYLAGRPGFLVTSLAPRAEPVKGKLQITRRTAMIKD